MKLPVIREAVFNAAFGAKGYPIYGGTPALPRPYDLNIFFVRRTKAAGAKANKYDDLICVAYRDEQGRRRIFTCWGTVDPGTPGLKSPKNPKGTAVIAEGFYKAMLTLGLHKGKVPALVQAGSVTVHRDNDRDGEPETEDKPTETGIFGINLHPNSPYRLESEVGPWSEGCAVPQRNEDMDEILRLARLQVSRGWGSRFSVAVFSWKDFFGDNPNP